ncbi:hypothetical protein RHGRI_006784 [Rhododendron griersonianum]|uniref:Transposase n=1 Tax=Rhododendron griersonianum TaxID=479676 RepID=A0AAV6KVL1_9ERIC|nr:hypothetical protein RHGRI_006784 [Rhododendron griersonianum]
MRIQEWTEIVADPRWKTFIRRYNRRNKSGDGGRVVRHGKFQSDPLSYALNFDEGENNGDLDEEENVTQGNFLMQYAAIPPASTDLGKDAPQYAWRLKKYLKTCE